MKRAPNLPVFAVLAPVALAVLLAACSSGKRPPGDNQPTLASLSKREVKLPPDPGVQVAEEQTIAAYRNFLAAAPKAPQRSEALRRLGDLEMDRADKAAGDGLATTANGAPDYKAAIAQYQEFLKSHPNDPRTDRVLYQLSRAQEQGGDLETALKTLNRLVTTYPGTQHADEAHFRRGELLFTTRQYKDAEAAFATVLKSDQQTPFVERALYMQGWSLFKLGRLEDALQPFFGVLDTKLGALDANAREEPDLAELKTLTRADRELVEDTFRVMSISLQNLQGAESIPKFTGGENGRKREGYQFRVYQQLADLYVKQERIKDAADTLAAFVRRQPLHVQAPLLQARVIEIYEKNGFENLALQAKRDHVVTYGARSEFRRANPSGWQRAQPLVKTHLVQLAQHHHALAQKAVGTPQAGAEAQEAVRWYRALLGSFPDDSAAPNNRFLLAELLYEQKQWAGAATEYETVAYADKGFARAADAGYAALLAYAAQEKDVADAAQRTPLQRTSVASSLRFVDKFPADTRSGPVLTRAAEQLFGLGDTAQASTLAKQALALNPPPAPEQRRVAWTVVAHHAFEQKAFADAERAYGQVLALTADGSAGRGEMVERLAASIYKQGEAARSGGAARDAVGHFERVAALGALPANSAVRATAQYDAAAALVGLKDWERASRALEDFRRQHPQHPLQAEVAPQLALAYLELGRSSAAAAELERVAAASQDATLARGALWQAAELHEKAAANAAPKSPLLASAIRGYERYLQQYPQPIDPAMQARWRLATLTRQDAQLPKALAWVRSTQQADLDAGAARTPLSRSLGGQAALQLTEPLLDAYRKVPLIEPLQKQLKLKKAKMEDVLRAYTTAAEVQSAEVTTQATLMTALLYQDFGKALMGSQRPKKLNKAELEQYNVMLEEQAFPFEEKAIALHEANAKRAASGIYDTSVKSSYAELAKLKPVRWGKVERLDASLPIDLPAIEAALKQQPQNPRLLTQLGVLKRQQGQFADARTAYEAAIAADANNAAAHMNLAILSDLYLGDRERALALYQRCLELSPGDAQVLGRWVAELKARKPDTESATATVARGKES